MSTGRNDIELDQRCAHCGEYLIIMVGSDGVPSGRIVVVHEDPEWEADHRVTRLTE